MPPEEITKEEIKATILFKEDGSYVFVGDNSRVAKQKLDALFTQKGSTTENIWTLYRSFVFTEDGRDKSSVAEFLAYLDKI